jgi:hypothetical protein
MRYGRGPRSDNRTVLCETLLSRPQDVEPHGHRRAHPLWILAAIDAAKILAAQIDGRTFYLDMSSKDAGHRDEYEQRLHQLPGGGGLAISGGANQKYANTAPP